MRPRLKFDFLSDRACKATEPSITRESLDNIFSSIVVNDRSKAIDVRMIADVVIDGSQLNDLAKESDAPIGA